MAVCPVIFGCAGPALSARERDFFADADPAGFILFARNCKAPDQVRTLVASLRAAVGPGGCSGAGQGRDRRQRVHRARPARRPFEAQPLAPPRIQSMARSDGALGAGAD